MSIIIQELIFTILFGFGLYKIFEKAGETPAFAFIPVYQFMIASKLATGEVVLGILTIIPFVGWIPIAIISYKLVKKFNADDIMAILAALFGPIVLAIVGFGDYEYIDGDYSEYDYEDEYYTNPHTNNKNRQSNSDIKQVKEGIEYENTTQVDNKNNDRFYVGDNDNDNKFYL